MAFLPFSLLQNGDACLNPDSPDSRIAGIRTPGEAKAVGHVSDVTGEAKAVGHVSDVTGETKP